MLSASYSSPDNFYTFKNEFITTNRYLGSVSNKQI